MECGRNRESLKAMVPIANDVHSQLLDVAKAGDKEELTGVRY